MYDPLELIGRYVLTGIICYGALIIMLMVRLIYVAFSDGNGGLAFIEAFNSSGTGTKAGGKRNVSIPKTLIEFALWPYGLFRSVDRYIKKERLTIRKMSETG